MARSTQPKHESRCVRSPLLAHRCRIDAPTLLGAIVAVSAAQALAADPGDAASRFLQRYVALTATADVAVLELYHDEASVHVTSDTGNGTVHSGVVSGKHWKQRLRAGWFDGSARLEAASFKQVSVTRQGDRLVIQAQRYAQATCYWDLNYAVALQSDATSELRIVAERIHFQPNANCRQPPAASTATRAAATIPATQGSNTATNLPKQRTLPPNVIPLSPLHPNRGAPNAPPHAQRNSP